MISFRVRSENQSQTKPKATEWLRRAHCWFLIALPFVFGGCGDTDPPPPRLGVANWKPPGIAGPIEVRPLPPADQVSPDYQQWFDTTPERKARVYEKVLHGASNQINFVVQTRRGKTPMGEKDSTWAYFTYKDATNGHYELFWTLGGRQNADFLRLKDRPTYRVAKVEWPNKPVW